jgi:hypothetical protein
VPGKRLLTRRCGQTKSQETRDNCMMRNFIIFTLHQIRSRIRLEVYVTRMKQMKNAYKILAGKSKRNSLFGKYMPKEKDNIQMNLIEINFANGLNFLL